MTLRSLVDKHAPLRMQRLTRNKSKACWFDAECRAMKRETRKLERQYGRLRTQAAKTAWRDHFRRHTGVKRWTSTATMLAVWRVLSDSYWTPHSSHQPPSYQSTSSLISFVTRSRWSGNPQLQPRHLSSYHVVLSLHSKSLVHAVIDSEIQSLLATMPATYCPVDPIPTWLLKELLRI